MSLSTPLRTVLGSLLLSAGLGAAPSLPATAQDGYLTISEGD